MNISNNYQMSAHSSAALIPFSTRFDNALKEPVGLRCQSLSILMHESISTNIKEIQLNYQTLIENIFSFGSQSHSEWGLKLISKANYRDFESIFGFLDYNGSLFQLIRYLMNDPINRYEFPKTCLPVPTKLSLEEGVIPSLLVNKMSHGFANTISLNAFEFYLFHFSYYMLNTTPNVYYQQNPYYFEQQNNRNNASDLLYFALLESYLNYFMPQSNANTLNNQQQSSQHSSIWQSLSSTTSSLLHLGSGSQSYNSKQQTSSQTSALFKSSLLNLKPLLSSSMYANENSEKTIDRIQYDPLGTQISKCETVLLILVEMWLNHAIPHSLNKKHLSPSHQPIFTPSSDHMKAVRIFIKHIHYFANSYDKKLNETLRVITSSPLDDVKNSIWSSKYPLQKKLYSFLRLSFERWPNDSSFRIPLETWLSYVQPWRYTINSLKDSQLNCESDRDSADDHITTLDYQWKQFISDNLLFYTVIFRQLISRFSKLLEFTSYKNAYMLFRLTKVFSQNNLWRWIKESEESFLMNDVSLLSSYSWNTLSTSRTNLLSPSIRQPNVASIAGNFKHPLMELESNTFEYIPLFSSSIKSIVMHLLTEISKSINILDDMLVSTTYESNSNSTSSFNIFAIIISLFQANDHESNADESKRDIIEKKKTKNYLQMCSTQLSLLFEIPEPHTFCDYQSQSQSTINDSPTQSLTRRIKDKEELFYEQNGTSKLTALGRYQVLNRLCKPELNTLEGNPDQQPVRTYEFYYLVRLFLFISLWINDNYGQHIIRAYNKQSFLGLFLRQLISSPISYVQVVRNNTNRPPDRVMQELPPRINLRFLANKFNLFYAFIVITIVYIFNYSLISFFFLSFLIFLFYILTKCVVISVSNNLSH